MERSVSTFSIDVADRLAHEPQLRAHLRLGERQVVYVVVGAVLLILDVRHAPLQVVRVLPR